MHNVMLSDIYTHVYIPVYSGICLYINSHSDVFSIWYSYMYMYFESVDIVLGFQSFVLT